MNSDLRIPQNATNAPPRYTMPMVFFFFEFLGASILMFVVLYTHTNAVLIGITVALLILFATSLGSPLSSFNPATSIAKVALNLAPVDTLAPVVLCQVMGALVGAEIFKRVSARRRL
jgi:glycerol uptake facilitator-like aquaporin